MKTNNVESTLQYESIRAHTGSDIARVNLWTSGHGVSAGVYYQTLCPCPKPCSVSVLIFHFSTGFSTPGFSTPSKFSQALVWTFLALNFLFFLIKFN
jgi:hypothetical protein